MHWFTCGAGCRFWRRGAPCDLAQAEPGVRQLAVIGGGIAGSSLVLSAHFLEPAGRFGGAAPPVGSARANNRIGRAFIDAGEMLQRGGWVVEKAQRDPAGHEVVFGTIIWIDRWRGPAHDPIGGCCLAEID